jgi:hypothetical protein
MIRTVSCSQFSVYMCVVVSDDCSSCDVLSWRRHELNI